MLEEEYAMLFIDMQKLIIDEWKIMIKMKNCHWDVNDLYRWAMPQKLPANGFKWVENRKLQ